MAEFVSTSSAFPGDSLPTELPEALQVPTKPVSLVFMLAIGAVEFAFFICYIGLGALLLPLQIGQLAPGNKIVALSLFTGISVLIALVSNPITGALSDRTTSRFGRRRPWIIAGGVFSALSLLLMMQASTLPLLFIGWCGIQLFSNMALAAVTATIPDQVPVNQRGMVSAIFGLGIPFGGIVGSILVGQVFKTPANSYGVMLVLVLLTTIPLGMLLQDKILPKGYLPAFNLLVFVKNFWIDPRKYPDFGWAWLTRFIPFIGYFMGTGYIFYYLQDAVKYPSPLQGASTFQIVSTVVVVVSTLVGGILSDRLNRRKPFVVAAAIILAVALLILGFFQSWPFVIAGAAVLGLGFGAYLTVDVAITTLVLPSADNRAKDMGIVNIASTLPQSLAPVIAGFILSTTHSYTLLFGVAAIFVLLGIVVVSQIKSVQ